MLRLRDLESVVGNGVLEVEDCTDSHLIVGPSGNEIVVGNKTPPVRKNFYEVLEFIWKPQQQRPSYLVEEDERYHLNAAFVTYYTSVLPAEELDKFLGHCVWTLPTTFRVLASCPFSAKLRQTYEEVRIPGTERMYQLNVSKQDVRGEVVHKQLVAQTTAGFVYRQELVSMLPVQALQLEAGHSVLDLCAAPGSKTQQIVDHLSALGPSGLVVANDLDFKRARYIVSNTSQIGFPGLIVCKSDATQFPVFYRENGSQFQFDRVLCDVVCSGDGTIRKNLDVSKKWTEANSLKGPQLGIARRAVSQVKVGGLVVYSTCSMKKSENEDVVGALLRLYGKSLRIETFELPEFVMREGMAPEAAERDPRKVLSVAERYTEEEITAEVTKCCRIYPHLNNTGGFFLCVLRKVSDTFVNSPSDFMYTQTDYQIADPEVCRPWSNFFKTEQLRWKVEAHLPPGRSQQVKRVYLINDEAAEFLALEGTSKLHILNVGTPFVELTRSKLPSRISAAGGSCLRIMQQDLGELVPVVDMGEKLPMLTTEGLLRFRFEEPLHRGCVFIKSTALEPIFGNDRVMCYCLGCNADLIMKRLEITALVGLFPKTFSDMPVNAQALPQSSE